MPSGQQQSHADGYGISLLSPQHDRDDRDFDVDIVFIHGLGGKRHKTWTKGDCCWPRDLLAKDFPKARIMTWGYDSRVMKFFGPVGQGSIHSHANELNNDLSQERSEPHQIFRPLIFFAHSLGGLVLKHALFNSWIESKSESMNVDRTAAIERSTIAVIFAGTPHQGSDKAKWANIATKLATIIQKDHNSKLSESLRKGSDTIETLQHWFKNIENHFQVFTLVEEVPVHKVGAIVEADSAAVRCHHEKRRMIHANHMEMVRFDHKDNNEYKKIKDIFKQAHQQVIYGSRKAGVDPPSRTLDTFRSQSGGLLEGHKPDDFTHRLSSVNQPEQLALGRIESLSLEDLGQTSRRCSNDQLLIRESSARSREQLAQRASTTTLGTLSSSSSHNSQPMVPPRESRGQSSGDEVSKYNALMDQGRHLAKRTDRNYATNLLNAKSCFQQARSLLSPESPSGRANLASLDYQLLDVEFNMAFHRDMTLHEKLSHLQAAEQHAWDAAYNARQSTEKEEKGGGGGGGPLLAQVQLYNAIIKGRRAEIHARMQVPEDAVRRQKEDASSEIVIALEAIRAGSVGRVEESERFADTWLKRLQTAPLSQHVELNGTLAVKYDGPDGPSGPELE